MLGETVQPEPPPPLSHDAHYYKWCYMSFTVTHGNVKELMVTLGQNLFSHSFLYISGHCLHNCGFSKKTHFRMLLHC